MKQEDVNKSACKGCEHIEHVEGALLAEGEYACTASVFAIAPAGCPERVKPDVRVLNLEITDCLACPYTEERDMDVVCQHTGTFLTKNTIKECMAMSRRAVPEDCPLEVKHVSEVKEA